MDTRHLIDGIVQQTTVLIAQLATAAGIRAPLAHIADQVFLDLARQIEAQGVGRKVVADMFGLALRTYQKKVQRLTESATTRDRTLWEAVLDYLMEHERAPRQQLVNHFSADGELEVGAVLNDLVAAGLVYCTGRGSSALYGKTSVADQEALDEQQKLEAATHLIWVRIYRDGPLVEKDVVNKLLYEPDVARAALDQLMRDGRVSCENIDGRMMLRASGFVVPVGSEQGWEAAIFDHFRAVATAIGSKVRQRALRSQSEDRIGGATLSFDLYAGHPKENEVYGLLQKVRADVNVLWNEVSALNRQHPIAENERVRVWFYLGQSIEDGTEGQAERS